MKSRMHSANLRTKRKTFHVDPEQWKSHGTLELEAAAALLMLRYQYDVTIGTPAACTAPQTTTPPTPPPPSDSTVAVAPLSTEPSTSAAAAAAAADKCTPKEQVRSSASMAPSSQPLKKRTIPPHLLRRSLTPARSPDVPPVNTSVGGISKAKLKLPPAQCNKALLKSCRNMIREFLDNQELM